MIECDEASAVAQTLWQLLPLPTFYSAASAQLRVGTERGTPHLHAELDVEEEEGIGRLDSESDGADGIGTISLI